MARRRRERHESDTGLSSSCRSTDVADADWVSLAGGPALFPLPLAQIALVPRMSLGTRLRRKTGGTRLTIARAHGPTRVGFCTRQRSCSTLLSKPTKALPGLDFSPYSQGNKTYRHGQDGLPGQITPEDPDHRVLSRNADTCSIPI